MDPRDALLADTQRKFAEFADRLTLEEARECQANIAGFLRLLIEWQSRAEDQTPLPSSDPTDNDDSTLPSHSQRKGSHTFARVH
jgi:hypothetical protein